MFKNKLLFFIVSILLFGLAFVLFCDVNESKINGGMANEFFKEENKEKFNFSTVEVDGVLFDIVTVDSENINSIKFYYQDENDQKIESINHLRNWLNSQEEELVFAMNGGIFAEDFKPLGLYVENGKEISEINLKEEKGNFYLQPNGVFVIQNKSAKIVRSLEYESSSENLFAVQSGPLLVIDDEINSVFNKDSENKYIRNGVGITKEGNIIFAISNEPVSFYNFALLFKEYLSCDNALYLDGAISEMYVVNEREIVERDFSTMIGIVE